MKIAIVADVHLGVPKRTDDIIWALKQVRKYCQSNSISNWIIIGDLLHDRETINIRDLNYLTEFLEETDLTYKQHLMTFPGNHDMYLKNSWSINSLKPLSRHLEYIDTVSTYILDNSRFWIVPFMHDEKEYMNVIDTITKDYKKMNNANHE